MNSKWLIMIFIIIAACKIYVPPTYKFKGSEIRVNPYGSWMELSFRQPDNSNISTVAGELLAMEQDSLYLLMADGMVHAVDINSVSSASLCTHKNQAGTYFLVTLGYSLPSIIGMIAHPVYSLDFFSLGFYIYVAGLYHILREEFSSNNFLIYPKKNSLFQFKAFARYPGGLPENIDFSELFLKKNTIVYKAPSPYDNY
jgi:hypothetical protein